MQDNGLSPQERKLLFAFVREAISKPGSDTISTTGRNTKVVERLRKLGFIAPNEDSLTQEAFFQYVDTFEKVTPPKKVQEWVNRLGVHDLRWRQFDGRMKGRMGQGIGKAYPLLSTVFMGDDPLLETWFHELAHVVFPRLDKQLVKRLEDAMRERYPVLRHDKLPIAIDPVTNQPTALPEGLYLKINGQYLGLDHSDAGAGAIDDEMWAHAFGLYCIRFEFPSDIKACIEEMIDSLSHRSAVTLLQVNFQ